MGLFRSLMPLTFAVEMTSLSFLSKINSSLDIYYWCKPANESYQSCILCLERKCLLQLGRVNCYLGNLICISKIPHLLLKIQIPLSPDKIPTRPLV